MEQAKPEAAPLEDGDAPAKQPRSEWVEPEITAMELSSAAFTF